jgi:ribose transport system substrate-binding protein
MKAWLQAYMIVLLVAVISALMSSHAFAKMKIVVVGKTKNDSFYEQSFAGCQEFAKTHPDLECIYDGPADFQDARSQENVILELLEKGIDGILVSTTDSNFLARRALVKAQEMKVPVITFDSDLLPEHQALRMAYVGTNNFDFGVALGNYAKKFKKGNPTRICIQSGSPTTPNLNERIRGVRYALSGTHENKKLDGENGWVEYVRCPFFTYGKRDRAITQLEYLLAQKNMPIYLAVAGFAQFSPDYIKTVAPHKIRVLSKDAIIISADAEALQLEALEQGLSTVNIGQRPFEMGRYSAELMYNFIVDGKKPEKEVNYLGFYYCTMKDSVDCALD